MRRVLTVAFVVLATAVLAAPASAITPTERKLIRQVRILQRQVKQLKQQVAVAHDLGLIGIFAAGCTAAATADAFQGTWKVIEAHEATGTSMFGVQQPVNDYQVCSQALTQVSPVNRAPNQATVSVFQAILNIFRP